jgi:hypothetical protein
VCQRKQIGTYIKSQLLFPASLSPSLFDIFELMLLKKFIMELMLPFMNEQQELGKVKYGEFIQCLGLWFLMPTIPEPS